MPAAFRLFGAVMLVLPHAGLAFSSGAPASLCSSSTFAAGRARLCGVESLRARGQKSAEGRRALGIRRAPKCGASRASMAHLAEAAETTDSAAARGGAYEGIHHLEFWVTTARSSPCTASMVASSKHVLVLSACTRYAGGEREADSNVVHSTHGLRAGSLQGPRNR